MAESIRRTLKTFASDFDRRLDSYLSPPGDAPEKLVEAIRYSALAPGKRIRPYLVMRCCELVGGESSNADPVAAAIECVHAFSLIHDDLPAMDDDELRRGRPTCHKKFGEATAILAGDALVVLAFELIARQVDDAPRVKEMVLELARGAGWTGMIGGQSGDLEGQSQATTLELTKYIHKRKTARLFESACRLGVIAGGGSAEAASSLGKYGQFVGRAFQIADDLLDLTSTAGVLGKSVGKDTRANKQTYPLCVGLEGSREAAGEAVEVAVSALMPFGSEAEDLRLLALYVVDRNY